MNSVLLTGNGFSHANFERLRDSGFDVLQSEQPLPADKLSDLLKMQDACILGGPERLTAGVLERASKLRIISFVGTGVEAFVDTDSARERNIIIKNTPRLMTVAVSEHTLGMILGLQRRLFEYNSAAKASRPLELCSDELSTSTVGIVGMGAIGAHMARLLTSGFGCRVLYHSRTRKHVLEDELGMSFLSLPEIFARCDVIVLAMTVGKETVHVIDERLLNKAKEGLRLVNTAGASLVEPSALRSALLSGRIAATAFDGYYIEPLPSVEEDPHSLLCLPDSKFIVSPHAAASTRQSWRRMIDLAVENLVSYFPSE